MFMFAAAFIAATLVRAQQPAATPVPEIPGLPAAARAAAASIDPEKIRAHVRFLSLDLLEGRGPGKRGAELAAEYIATQFALAALGGERRWVPLSVAATMALTGLARKVLKRADLFPIAQQEAIALDQQLDVL